MSTLAIEQERPGRVAAWILAARPRTLAAAIAPVAIGTALARAERPFAAAAALGGAIALQIGANFANDVFDFERGADGEDRLGPPRATSSGWITPRAMRLAMIAAFAAATACGAVLAVIAGWPVIAIGIASIAAAIAYTGGPWPLGYHGLGDVCVFVFFGLVAVCGTVFVESGAVSAAAWPAGAAVGALATAILVVNNLRDEDGDRVAGKRTLAVRFGRRAGLVEYAACLALAQLGSVAVAVLLRSPFPLLAVLTLPLCAALLRDVARGHGRELNPLLARTAKLLAIFGAVFTLGIALVR